jgi:dephospho-CoA kinase
MDVSMKKDNKRGMRLGITGGIGSGKSTVCRVFSVLGIPVFSADTVANDIMDNDEAIVSMVTTIAGKELYLSGKLDRTKLASLIFNDNSLLEKINSLVHPIVFDRFKSWEQEQTTPYVILEAAILFESGGSKLCDRIATVVAPVEQRVGRIVLRNNLSREQILERMRNQMDDDSRIKQSDYIIHNAENDMIIPAILKIHDDILTCIKKGIL